jgi:hypothetical protein
MKIQMLVLDEKHEDRYIYVPPGMLNEVMLKIAQQRDKEGVCYLWMNDRESALLSKIRRGDASAARQFFQLRSTAEYEYWRLVELEDVLDEKKEEDVRQRKTPVAKSGG